MWSKINRDLMLVTGGRVATLIIGLISLRVVTTILTPEQYGALSLLIVVQTFCGLFIMNPVGQYINLHTHAWWDDGTILAKLRWYRRYVLAGSFIGGILVLFISNPQSISESLWVAGVVFYLVFAGTWNSTLVPLLNMLGFRGYSVLWAIVTQVTALSLSVIFSLWYPNAITWIAGQAVGMTVGLLGARYTILKQSVDPRFYKGILPLINRKAIITYCLPLAFATGLMWLQMSGYRIIIENYWGLAQLGFFALGLHLAGQIFSLSESLAMQFLYPLFFRRVSKYEDQQEVKLAISDLMNTLAPVYLVIAGFIVFGAPYLLIVLVAPQFQEAIYFVVLGSGIELCRVIGNLLSNVAHVRRQTKLLALPYGIGAMTSIVMIFLAGVNSLDIIWAAVALIISSILMLIFMWTVMLKRVKFKLDIKPWVCGIAFALAMVISSNWISKEVTLSFSIIMLALLAIPVCFIIFVILRNNPAVLRMLNAELRKK